MQQLVISADQVASIDAADQVASIDAADQVASIDAADQAASIAAADQAANIDADTSALVSKLDDVDTLLAMPLTEAKRLAAAEFERHYLVRVMERAGGSVSAGARLSGLDRTNFRRLLQRHGLHGSSRNVAIP